MLVRDRRRLHHVHPSRRPDGRAALARTAAAFGALRADLEALVRIPSVSNAEFDQAHVAASADAVVGAAARTRASTTCRCSPCRAGAPAVVGRRPAPEGAPTVLLYAHHDVQPPGDDADWDSPPFEPTERGGRLYGRGAADDKAGVIAHVGALRVLGDDLGVGVTVFVEGEEEIGSPTFTAVPARLPDLLAADVIVVADSSNWAIGVPGLTTSLRGLVDCVVEVAVLEHAVHSGMFGGAILDAPTLLARLITTLHDDEGNVAVAGLVHAPDPTVDYDEADVPRRRQRARRRPARGHRTDHRPAVDPPRDRRHRLRRAPRGERVEHDHPARVGQALGPARPRPGPGRRDGRAAHAPASATRPSAPASP